MNRQTTGDTPKRNRHKQRPPLQVNVCFEDKYEATGEELGRGAYGKVISCTLKAKAKAKAKMEVAVKVIDKTPGLYSRSRVLKEIETFYICQGHPNILQLLEFFEEQSCFYLVFEKMLGGPLLDWIQSRTCFSEREASSVIRDLAEALQFLHNRGIAHRDLKPENVLCVRPDSVSPVKLCDFDLCSKAATRATTPKLQTPVGSLEYMAPEVLNAFFAGNSFDYDEEDPEEDSSSHNTYDKKCDLWSLGVIMHILLSGRPPFTGNCGQECGWDNGESCRCCQDLLSSAIKEGLVDLSGEPWNHISQCAKDLLKRLLVKDSKQRIDTSGLLKHAWIAQNQGSGYLLETPGMLARQSSLQDISEFAQSAMTLNRSFSTEAEVREVTKCHSVDLSKSHLLQRRNKLIRQLDRQRSDFCSIDENPTD